MASNPARTFALVNLAVFVLALAAFLWLRSRGTFDGMGTSSSEPVAQTVDSTAHASAVPDSVSVEAVEPASAAQRDFLNEVLRDTARTVQSAYIVASYRHDTAYYVGARVDSADATRVGLWYMRGPRDAPQSVKALNTLGERYALAGRVDPAQDGVAVTDAEAQALLRYLDNAER